MKKFTSLLCSIIVALTAMAFSPVNTVTPVSPTKCKENGMFKFSPDAMQTMRSAAQEAQYAMENGQSDYQVGFVDKDGRDWRLAIFTSTYTWCDMLFNGDGSHPTLQQFPFHFVFLQIASYDQENDTYPTIFWYALTWPSVYAISGAWEADGDITEESLAPADPEQFFNEDSLEHENINKFLGMTLPCEENPDGFLNLGFVADENGFFQGFSSMGVNQLFTNHIKIDGEEAIMAIPTSYDNSSLIEFRSYDPETGNISFYSENYYEKVESGETGEITVDWTEGLPNTMKIEYIVPESSGNDPQTPNITLTELPEDWAIPDYFAILVEYAPYNLELYRTLYANSLLWDELTTDMKSEYNENFKRPLANYYNYIIKYGANYAVSKKDIRTLMEYNNALASSLGVGETVDTQYSGYPFNIEAYEADCLVYVEPGVYLLSYDYRLVGIFTDKESLILPEYIRKHTDSGGVRLFYFGDEEDGHFYWMAENLRSITIPAIMEFHTDFSVTNITDIYIQFPYETTAAYEFRNSNNENINIHCPLSFKKNNQSAWPFSECNLLIGDETADMPIMPSADYRVWLEKGVTCMGVKLDNYCLVSLYSTSDYAQIPAYFTYEGTEYQISYFGYFNNSYCNVLELAPNLKSLEIAEDLNAFYFRWDNYGKNITDLYLRGSQKVSAYQIPSYITVHVDNRDTMDIYKGDYSWSNATLVPWGWDYDWLNVKVERTGYFAQTYLEMTNNDWAYGIYVKVTGPLNSNDLSNIKQLSNLIKLDLTEAEFTSLPESCLSGSKVTEVRFPENLTSISRYCFQNCSNLTTVEAPGITTIGDYAFRSCYALTSVDFPNLVSIGSNAFNNTGLMEINYSKDIKFFGSYAFARTQFESFDIPETVTMINDNLFYYCSNLQKVTMSDNVTEIGKYAFEGCSNLTDIELSKNLATIGSGAFANCSGLTEITLPSRLTFVGYRAFSDCTGLREFNCKAAVPPSAPSSFTDGMSMINCNLNVPSFSIDAYREHENWGKFYRLYALNTPIDYILVNRPVYFNINEEDSAILQDSPDIDLSYSNSEYYTTSIGQLTIEGDGTMSAGNLNYYGQLSSNSYDSNYLPTLINSADKMRTDAISVTLDFQTNYWHFITLPFDCEVKDIQPSENCLWVIREYDGAARAESNFDATWVNLTQESTMKAGKGYIVSVSDATGSNYHKTLTFPSRNSLTKNNIFRSTSVILGTDDIEEHESEFAHNRSWNLVGNPYPAYFRIGNLTGKNDEEFTTPITIYKDNAYQAYSPIDDADLTLRPFESFFIQRPLDFEEMVFNANGRSHTSSSSESSEGDYYGKPASRPAVTDRQVFNFTLADAQGLSNRARVVLNEEASLGYEIERDAAKIKDTSMAIIYVAAEQDYDICERPYADGKAYLGVKAPEGSALTLSLNGRFSDSYTVTLRDLLTGENCVLNGTDFAFTASSDDSRRFEIEFLEAGEISGLEAIFGIGSDVTVTALDGTIVFRGSFSDFNATPGVYVISNGKRALKTILK